MSTTVTKVIKQVAAGQMTTQGLKKKANEVIASCATACGGKKEFAKL